MNKTKIVCTIGPASQDLDILRSMIRQGMNVARLNFSHGEHSEHAEFIKNIRMLSVELELPVAIMQDLQGPKIRVENLEKPIEIKSGDKIVIGKDFKLDFDISDSVKKGQSILIEDGLMEFKVEKVLGQMIHCVALNGGKILSHKGVNLPETQVTFPILTEKDLEDLKFGIEQDVDYISLSFVRNAKDIVNLKNLIEKFTQKNKVPAKVIAKIEKPEALKEFNEILKETDAVMIARGDLGVEISDSIVPVVQKTIIQKCIAQAKPVIVATQMLDSMIRNPRPTRAEVSDVANAVIDQADAVMLSGESAFGKYPLKAVEKMSKIIQATEKSAFLPEHKHLMSDKVDKAEAVAEGVFDIARHVEAKLIVGATMSGFTAREISHKRPKDSRLVMLTPYEKIQRQMSLFWGVESYIMPMVDDFEGLLKEIVDFVKKKDLVKKGERMIIVTSEPSAKKEDLDLVTLKEV